MHEEALVRSLRAKIDELSGRRPGERIVRASVLLGPLAHLDEPALRALWSRTMRGSAAELASLEVVPVATISDPRASSVVLRSVTFEDRPASVPSGSDRPAVDRPPRS